MGGKTIGSATGVSLFFSGLASAVGLCCVAPWVVPLFGVSGAILFARLGPYRPWFIGAAALAMAMALWGAYRYRKTCAADAGGRRRLLWLNALLVVGILVLGFATVATRLAGFLESHVLS